MKRITQSLLILFLVLMMAVNVYSQTDEETNRILEGTLITLGCDRVFYAGENIAISIPGVDLIFTAEVYFLPDNIMRIDLMTPIEASFAVKNYNDVRLLERPFGVSDDQLMGIFEIVLPGVSFYKLMTETVAPMLKVQPSLETGEISGREVYIFSYDKIHLSIYIDKQLLLPLAIKQYEDFLFNVSEFIIDENDEVSSVVYEAPTSHKVSQVLTKVDGSFLPSSLLIESSDAKQYYEFTNLTSIELPVNKLIPEGLFPKVQDMFDEALLLYDDGRLEEAAALLEEVVLEDPYHVDAYYCLGVIYDKLGDWFTAISYYEQVLMLDPDHENAANNLAYMYIDYEINVERGVEIARRVVEKDQTPPQMDTLAWGLYKTGEYQEALELMLEVKNKVEANPLRWETGYFYTYYHLACIYKALGDEENALFYAKLAEQYDPDDPFLLELLGEL